MIERFLATRLKTLSICAPLEVEDFVVQPSAFVSPPKWHLAHTTWFFETMVLIPYLENYKEFDESYRLLFNSYYKSKGRHWIQGERGHLSRPTVKEVKNYREHIDLAIIQLLGATDNKEVLEMIESGIHHEQQHQELLYMDIKYILAINPSTPSYLKEELRPAPSAKKDWSTIPEGVHQIGYTGDDFSYDNERPLHKTYLQGLKISSSLVTNSDFQDFIKDDGYKKPELWLSVGWDWINTHNIERPLYWSVQENQTSEFTLYGLKKIDLNSPVAHISFFEANAFAKWAGLRLPTEKELELFERVDQPILTTSEQPLLHPNDSNQKSGQLWSWTSSNYTPYPGFKEFDGNLKEYNGKFMHNQMVLKGGCIATPKNHYRTSYRNFYQASQRWMFSGIRLAKDI